MITFVLGGRRSGKSNVAQSVIGLGDVTYLATAIIDSPLMEARRARHQNARPKSWQVIEEPHDIVGVLRRVSGDVLVEDLTSWIRNDVKGRDISMLAFTLSSRPGNTVLVSEDVSSTRGMSSPEEEQYYDRLGELNQVIAQVSDACLFVVAGRAIPLPRWPGEQMEFIPIPGVPGHGAATAPARIDVTRLK